MFRITYAEYVFGILKLNTRNAKTLNTCFLLVYRGLFLLLLLLLLLLVPLVEQEEFPGRNIIIYQLIYSAPLILLFICSSKCTAVAIETCTYFNVSLLVEVKFLGTYPRNPRPNGQPRCTATAQAGTRGYRKHDFCTASENIASCIVMLALFCCSSSPLSLSLSAGTTRRYCTPQPLVVD